MSIQRPEYLQPGDTVGVLGLACKVNIEQLEQAFGVLESWGLHVVRGRSLRSAYHQFAGDDATRAADFQAMLNDPTIKAIFSARGGYGSSRIIDSIDFGQLLRQPKWVIGFSDITAVHAHLHTLGVVRLHATMPKLFGQEGGEQALATLYNALFGKSLRYEVPSHVLNREGVATGQVVGGNLCLLAHGIGTASDIDTAGKILFLEDVSEYLYNLDRMLLQLRRAGKLSHLAGLVAGYFSDLKDNETPFGKTAYEIIQEHTQAFGYPVCYGFAVGHEPDNWALPCGEVATLSVGATSVLAYHRS